MSASPTQDIALLDDVSHRFGAKQVLHGFGLRVQRGDVYGLIGLNGAGKTTALRIMLRFLKRQQGRVELFGLSQDEHWLEVANRIGATIETPAFYPNLSGRMNLELLYELSGVEGGRGPEEALEQVGLATAGDVPFQSYSQGMKQRLYLGQALLGHPELLILDEPTSNLDPLGILDVRTLIQRLNRELDLTIILSSHQLGEVAGVCNRVGILHEGRRIAEASVDELFDAERCALDVEVDEPARALALLGGVPWVETPEADGDLIHVLIPRDRRAELNALLVRDEIAVAGLVERRPSLEDFFRRTVSGDA